MYRVIAFKCTNQRQNRIRKITETSGIIYHKFHCQFINWKFHIFFSFGGQFIHEKWWLIQSTSTMSHPIRITSDNFWLRNCKSHYLTANQLQVKTTWLWPSRPASGHYFQTFCSSTSRRRRWWWIKTGRPGSPGKTTNKTDTVKVMVDTGGMIQSFRWDLADWAVDRWRHQSGMSIDTTGRTNLGTSSLETVFPCRLDRLPLCPRLCDDEGSRPDWSTLLVVGMATASTSCMAWRALHIAPLASWTLYEMLPYSCSTGQVSNIHGQNSFRSPNHPTRMHSVSNGIQLQCTFYVNTHTDAVCLCSSDLLVYVCCSKCIIITNNGIIYGCYHPHQLPWCFLLQFSIIYGCYHPHQQPCCFLLQFCTNWQSLMVTDARFIGLWESLTTEAGS